jgi:hypothetical protein
MLLAQGQLIDDAVSPQPPDRRRICLIRVTLVATPRDETHGRSLHRYIYRLDGTFAASARARANPHLVITLAELSW